MKTVTTSVGFKDPLGVLVANGNLILDLSQSAEVTSGGGLIVPTRIILPLDVNAKIASTQIFFNDELTPSGTTYRATLLDAGGNRVADFGNWSIIGASADLSVMVPVSTAISYPAPVLLAPSGNQTIVQAAGTSLNVNRFENIRFADQFATISAAIADLGGNGGLVYIPAGTYLDNIVLSNNYTYLKGYGVGKTIIKPANTALPVVTIDATSSPGGALDSCGVLDLSIYPAAVTACDAGIQIKGSTVTNQPNDHHLFCNVEIGGNPFVARNTTGTNNFRVGLEIIGRCIWSNFERVSMRGTRGDGLKVLLTGGVVGPVNACSFTNCESVNNFGYGVNWNGEGAVTFSQGNSFENFNIQLNANNAALSPAAGAIFKGIDTFSLIESPFEENCAGAADVNRAHLRLTGTTVRNFNIFGGSFTNDTGTGAKYAIFGDATVLNGLWAPAEAIGNGFNTSRIHVAIPASGEMRTVPIIIPGFNFGPPEFVVDANGNSRAMSLSPLAFPVWSIGTAQFPVTANVLDLTNIGTAVPGNIYYTSSAVTINKITGQSVGHWLIIKNASGSNNTITNAVGGAGQITLYEGATRTLANGDAIMLVSQDGSTWTDVPLGDALLGKANTWTQNQSFSGIFSTYGGRTNVANGIPQIVAKFDATAQAANIGSTLLYAVPANGAGTYRISGSIIITQAATTSCTLPALEVVWTDNDTGGSEPSTSFSSTNSTNAVGTAQSGAGALGGGLINVKASTNINFLTLGYASSGATPMQFAAHVKLEYLGS